MKKYKKNCKWIVLLALCLGLVVAGFADWTFSASDKKDQDVNEYYYNPGGYNRAVEDYYVAPGFPPYPERAKFLGLLKGSWYEMGVQYGERGAELILLEFDGMLPDIKFDTIPYTHLKSDLARYEEQASYYSPELLEFIRGIADGAATELNKSIYGQYFTNYEKVLFINCHSSLTFRHPLKEDHAPGVWAASKMNEMASIQSTPIVEEGCSAFAVIGEKGGAKEQNALATQNRDIPFFPRTYEVVYIAEPDDPQANTFWALSSAGMIMANQIVNNRGLSIGHLSGGSSYAKDNAFGVPWPFRMAHAVIFTKDRDDAIEMMTLGTSEYRAATGRKTLLRDGDSNTIVADRHNCGVLETTAHWYAVRYPGYSGETGNYVVTTNHFVFADYSYDENNVKHEGLGMTRFGDAAGYISSGFRFSTLMWLIENNFGEIDDEMAREFMTSHFYVDADGKIVEKVWNPTYGWIPAQLAPGNPTVCRHSGGYPESNKGSTNDGKVANLTKNIIYWTLGRPCDWVGPWSSVYIRPGRG